MKCFQIDYYFEKWQKEELFREFQIVLSVQAEIQIGEFCIAIGSSALTTLFLGLMIKAGQKWAKLNFAYRDKNLWFNRQEKYSDL